MSEVTVVGGGIAGLLSAIAVAEAGSAVPHEATTTLGGRARISGHPYRANLGPHALYTDGQAWKSRRRVAPRRSSPP